MLKKRALIAIISMFLFAWSGILGCGTRSQVRVHEEEKEPELEMVQAVRQEAVAAVPYITLEWDASSGTDVAGYKIYYGTVSRNYDTVLDVGDYTSVSIADLEDNETYYFAVTAYNADGEESDYSDEVCINCADDDESGYSSEVCIDCIDPVHGTIGTQVDITKLSNLGEKKPKVLIGESKCKVLTFTPTSVSCLLKKVKQTMGPGAYDVTIRPKGKSIEPIVLEDAFSIMAPSIIDIHPVSGFPRDPVTITGSFFGTEKIYVFMADGIGGKAKKSKVVSLTMDSNTGASTLVILVPKKLAPGLYDVTVKNKIGEDTRVGGFSIQ